MKKECIDCCGWATEGSDRCQYHNYKPAEPLRLLYNRHHKDAPKGAIYIGRGSGWGNPAGIDPTKTRDEVCDEFEAHAAELFKDPKNWETLASIHGKALVCSCYPKRCHGETLIKFSTLAYEELQKDKVIF